MYHQKSKRKGVFGMYTKITYSNYGTVEHLYYKNKDWSEAKREFNNIFVNPNPQKFYILGVSSVASMKD